MLSEAEKRQLDEKGYLILANLIDRDMLASLRARVEELFVAEGAAAGSEFKLEQNARRLANLVNKGQIFEQAIATPRVLECMERCWGAGSNSAA
jgi:ectoine hydroxylase-related dioxygenase (phytanoyl-CoA dioxygenase family)